MPFNPIAFLSASKYGLLFLGTFIEGPIAMMSAGLLLHLGQITFWPAYLTLVAGDFIADLCWYWIGYSGARWLIDRIGHLFGATEKGILAMEHLFTKYDVRVLVLSKLTMGFGTGTATLIAAGMLRVPLFRFAIVNLVGGFVWTFILLTVGISFGNVFANIPVYFEVIFALIGITVVFFGLSKFSRFVGRVAE